MHKREHGRCQGTGGFELANGNVVPCAGCSRGYLIIYTAAERAALKQASSMRLKTVNIIKRRATELAKDMPGMRGALFADTVRQGFGILADEEPERLAKLYQSIENGRLDDVIHSLHSYREQQETRGQT
jgi:hypothetical protein